MRVVHRLRVASVVLLVAGAVVLAVAAVRIGLYWVIEPLNDVLVAAAGLLLAAGLVAAVLSLRVLQRRPLRAAAVLAIAGAAVVGVVRLVVELPADADGVLVPLVRYGPGTPPSISWSLLAWQVGGPVLAIAATALLGAALVLAVAGVASTVARLRLRLV